MVNKSLEILAQLTNFESVRPDVMTRIRTRYLTAVCDFNFSGLPLLLRQNKNKNGEQQKHSILPIVSWFSG
jgi:hypothetical protein